VAIVGAVIHALLLAFAQISFGSALVGVLVGMTMRMASNESAGTKYRITAAVLTFVAGFLPWLRSPGTTMSAVYLAIGMVAAWMLTARNARTEIHGPFQSKAV